MNWLPCPAPIVADVIRWQEAIWAAPAKKRGSKATIIGEQLITAEVKALGEYLQLHVRAIEVLRIEEFKKPGTPVKVGDNIKRKKTTITRGECHRLLWSDETAREAVARKQ